MRKSKEGRNKKYNRKSGHDVHNFALPCERVGGKGKVHSNINIYATRKQSSLIPFRFYLNGLIAKIFKFFMKILKTLILS